MIHHGDCLDVMATFDAESVDAIVTDPPYGLEFMGKEWDRLDTAHAKRDRSDELTDPGKRPYLAHSVAYQGGSAAQGFHYAWAREAFRVAKPGAHMLAFGGTRTYHRLAAAIEDAGWEIRDTLVWAYAQGFPKSLNVSNDQRFCDCDRAVPTTEHDVHPLRDGDVPEAERDGSGLGSVLFQAMPEPGLSAAPVQPAQGELRPAERRMEGRSDPQAPEGELPRSAGGSLSRVGEADGESERLRGRTPAGDGPVDGATVSPLRGGQPREPRPERQPAGEPDAVAVERGPQARGGWADCSRCGKPMVPAGLGTALKPSWEPIVLARKPLRGTVAGNVLEYGTGALNIAATRIGTGEGGTRDGEATASTRYGSRGIGFQPTPGPRGGDAAGRWPANVILTDPIFDGDTPGVVGGGEAGGDTAYRRKAPAGSLKFTGTAYNNGDVYANDDEQAGGYGDSGTYSRFFQLPRGETCDWCGASLVAPSSSLRSAPAASAPDPVPTEASPESSIATDSPTTSATETPFWPDADASTRSTRRSKRPGTLPASTPPSSPAKSPDAASPETGTTTTTPAPSMCATCAEAITSASTSRSPDRDYPWAFLIPKAARSDREPVLGGLPMGNPRGIETGDDAVGAGRGSLSKPRANVHPTVKPTELMRHLVRLVTPPGGTVLDPFLGSGTTALAAEMEGFAWIGIEREAEYVAIAEARLNGTQRGLGLVG